MAGAAAIASLRAAARECHAPSFTDEQAAQGLAVADELRARFLPPASLLQLPADILSTILSRLDIRDLARLAAIRRSLWSDAPTSPPPPRDIGLVETELRRRAEARCLNVSSSLPEGTSSWVAYLLKRDRRDAQMRQAPLSLGQVHDVFVDTGGRLLTCGRDAGAHCLGHSVDPVADLDVRREIGLATPVPSMQNRRIVSVSASDWHSLALSADGEVYSWGSGVYGALGHGDIDERAEPSRIQLLSRIERIAAGKNWATSAAVDENGRLFTWGRAIFRVKLKDSDGEFEEFEGPSGLGYELDAETEYQTTPKQVDALSQDRVLGVALGYGFTLVVTDAGAVFFFGCSTAGVLGYGSLEGEVLESEVLPRRIEALAEMGRFVAVAAGSRHSLALTEGGELYGWGAGNANGHGREERTPHRVAALIGKHVKLVGTSESASCAVTEKGELFTWGGNPLGENSFLGHEVAAPQATPKRVEAFVGARIAAVAMAVYHTLVADEDGAVWGFGTRMGLSLGATVLGDALVQTPTPIPTLRVRVMNSP